MYHAVIYRIQDSKKVYTDTMYSAQYIYTSAFIKLNLNSIIIMNHNSICQGSIPTAVFRPIQSNWDDTDYKKNKSLFDSFFLSFFFFFLLLSLIIRFLFQSKIKMAWLPEKIIWTEIWTLIEWDKK